MIQKRNILFIAFLIIISLNKNIQAQSCYELVWNDEFNYNGLPDSTLWSFEEGGNGWGNNELQYYTSKRIENAHVEDGFLTIEARKESYGGKNYTSARLITYPNGHSWKYGKIEARIKLPYGQGIWPAFWMLGNGIFEGTSWPGCGEIDIMEMVGGGDGRDDKIYGTMHYADVNNNHADYGGSYQLASGIFADDFHVFSIEWTETQLTWFLDGIQYHTASLTPTYLTELKKDFFLLLNIAVGGNWPGNPDASTVFPQKMLVDYVRVYQLNTQPVITGDTIVNKAQKKIKFKTVESEDFTYNWSIPAGATINEGQETNCIYVTWGCDQGNISCQITTNCDTYDLTLPVKTSEIEISGNEIAEIFSENNKYYIPELDATTYTWNAPNDVTFNGETDTNIIYVNWGSTAGYLIVNTSNNCGIENDSIYIDIVEQLPFPDPNVKHKIPGTIQAINYDVGGEGFAYHDSDPENQGDGLRQDEGVDTEYNDGGQNIGWIKPGEWVEYTVEVEKSGFYDIELRIASLNGGGQMEIHFSDEDRTGKISIPSTGSWSTFTSIYVNEIQLSELDTLLKLKFNIGDFNISRLIFNNAITSTETISSSLSNVTIYPNPVEDLLYLSNLNELADYHILNLVGQTIQSGAIHPGNNISINTLKTGQYILRISNSNWVQTIKFIKL